MITQILKSKKVLEKFPELAPLFKIEEPEGNCKPCVRGAFTRKVTTEYKRILRRSKIKESDIILYFSGDKGITGKKFGEAKITGKGVVNFANSLLKRVAATAKGERLLVSNRAYLARVYQCRTCDKLENGCCSICTCPISEKCKFETEYCPHPTGSRWQDK